MPYSIGYIVYGISYHSDAELYDEQTVFPFVSDSLLTKIKKKYNNNEYLLEEFYQGNTITGVVIGEFNDCSIIELDLVQSNVILGLPKKLMIKENQNVSIQEIFDEFEKKRVEILRDFPELADLLSKPKFFIAWGTS